MREVTVVTHHISTVGVTLHFTAVSIVGTQLYFIQGKSIPSQQLTLRVGAGFPYKP